MEYIYIYTNWAIYTILYHIAILLNYQRVNGWCFFWIEWLVRRHVLVCVGFMGSQCNDVYIGVYIYICLHLGSMIGRW